MEDDARARSELYLSRERRIDGESAGRIPIRRALTALERAADYLIGGMGREASLTLSAEAAQAKSEAWSIGKRHPDGRVLDAISANMSVRADGLRATVPAEAHRAAERLDRIAAGTEARALNLETAGRSGDAQLLRALAKDSRAQSVLFRSAAENTNGVLGRGLLGALGELGRPTIDALHAQRPQATRDVSEDRRALDLSLRELDRSLSAEPRSLDELIEKKSKPKNPRSELMRRAKAIEALEDHAATKHLLAPFAELAKGLNDGDPRAANLARTHILRELRKHEQLELLRQIVESRAHSGPPGKIPASEKLPLGLLKAILSGGLGPLAKDCSGPVLARWIDPGVRAIPDQTRLQPSEILLADIFRGKLPRASWPTSLLGSRESMLLGGDELFRNAGSVTKHLRANSGLLDGKYLVAFDRSAGPLTPLPAFGPHETAVFADSKGAILVRGPGGTTEWHDRHLFAADGSRVYFDVEATAEGIGSVIYQSASDSDRVFTRLEILLAGNAELERARGDAALISLESMLMPHLARQRALEREEDPRVPARAPKRRVYRGQTVDDVTAVVIFEPGPEPCGFRGLTTRHGARLAADELERANAVAPADQQIRFALLESAADAGDRLMLDGAGEDEAETFRAQLADILVEQGLAPKTTGALILYAPHSAEKRRPIKRGVSRGSGRGRAATFLPSSGGPSEELVLLEEHWRDPHLLESGVLLYQSGIVIE